jgi:hypothetical protein
MYKYTLICCINAKIQLKQNKYDRFFVFIQKKGYLCGKSK